MNNEVRSVPDVNYLRDRRQEVEPRTLAITHIHDGEEVVTGGDDGQVFIATFASAAAADRYVSACKEDGRPVFGYRVKPEEGLYMKVTEEMVTRFLQWKLPRSFRPDGGISFVPSDNPLLWPTGTNLLNDPEARAMLEHVLAAGNP